MENPVKHPPLNDAQLAILNLFNRNWNDEDIIDLKRILVTFLNERLQDEFERVANEKGYTAQTFENWLNEPNQ